MADITGAAGFFVGRRNLRRAGRGRRRFFGRQLQGRPEDFVDFGDPLSGLGIDALPGRGVVWDLRQINQFGGVGQMIHSDEQAAAHEFAEQQVGGDFQAADAFPGGDGLKVQVADGAAAKWRQSRQVREGKLAQEFLQGRQRRLVDGFQSVSRC